MSSNVLPPEMTCLLMFNSHHTPSTSAPPDNIPWKIVVANYWNGLTSFSHREHQQAPRVFVWSCVQFCLIKVSTHKWVQDFQCSISSFPHLSFVYSYSEVHFPHLSRKIQGWRHITVHFSTCCRQIAMWEWRWIHLWIPKVLKDKLCSLLNFGCLFFQVLCSLPLAVSSRAGQL